MKFQIRNWMKYFADKSFLWKLFFLRLMLKISENCFNNLSRGSIKLYAWCLSYVKKSAKTEERFLIYRARKFLLTSAKKYSKKVWKIDFHEKWKKFHYSYLICRIQCKKPQVHTLLSSKVSFKWYTTPLITCFSKYSVFYWIWANYA